MAKAGMHSRNVLNAPLLVFLATQTVSNRIGGLGVSPSESCRRLRPKCLPGVEGPPEANVLRAVHLYDAGIYITRPPVVHLAVRTG